MHRRPLSIVIAMLPCLSALSCSHGQSPVPSGPARIHVKETERELGDIPVTADGHEVRFRIVNRGLSDLKFIGLTTSCTCTGATATRAEIPPAESGEIVVRIRPRGPEEASAVVGVATNDPDRPEVLLRLKWHAVAALEFEPAELDFGVVRPGETVERRVRLARRVLGDETVAGEPEIVPAERLKAELDDDVLHVSLTASEEFGSDEGMISLRTEGGSSERLRLPVRWTVADVVQATPRRLYVGTGGPGAVTDGRVVLTATEGELDVIDATAIDLDNATAEVRRLDDRRAMVELHWRLPDSPGPQTGRLVIRCQAPEPKTIDVPVSAFVSGPEVASKGASP